MIIDKTLYFDNKDNLTHFPIEFNLQEDYDSLHIYFTYSPNHPPKETSIRESLKCLERYEPERIGDKDFLDLDTIELVNIITLSLFQTEKYIGARHSMDNPQKLIIGNTFSTPGFLRCEIIKGTYLIKLNLHSVLSPIEVKLQVRGVK